MTRLEIQCPSFWGESLRDLLNSKPVEIVETKSWGQSKFVITGTEETLTENKPAIDAWEHDCVSRAAW